MKPEASPTLQHLSNLTSSFGKNLNREQKLAALNALLRPLQRELEEQSVDGVEPAPVLILGAPRSGTTILSQLLASTGLFGLATNFVGRFWEAPAVGLMIETAMGLFEDDRMSSFESRRGVARDWWEPSEFGYFWSRFFDLGQETHALGQDEQARFDAAGLRKAIATMEQIAQRRMLLKNNTWFTLNAGLIADALPGGVLLVSDRDPYYVAQSLWLQRADLYGDTSRWWSVRPAEYRDIVTLDPLEQVAAQAMCIVRGMEAGLAQVAREKVFRVPYGRLAADPRGTIDEIVTTLGFERRIVLEALAKLPERLTSTDKPQLEPTQAALLKTHIDKWALQ